MASSRGGHRKGLQVRLTIFILVLVLVLIQISKIIILFYEKRYIYTSIIFTYLFMNITL